MCFACVFNLEGLDFTKALHARVSLLRGLQEKMLNEVWNRLELNDGAFSLIKCLKANGIKVALVSGGFTWFSNRIAHLLDLDEAVSNKVVKEISFFFF